jgi:multidrug efflux pump subunit AcrA (membrane-fusion protein)
MSIHFRGESPRRSPNRAPAARRRDLRTADLGAAPRSPHRRASSVCAALALAVAALGCNNRPPKPAEKVPPAPIKWEEARQVVLEEWTELVGSTLPLPDHAARVTSPVAGRVVAVLPSRYDLRLVPALDDASQLPTAGKSLIVLAAVKDRLHVRVFGSGGGILADVGEQSLMEQGPQVEALRKQLRNAWPPHELTASEADAIVTAVTTLVGSSLPSGDVKAVVEGQLVEDGDVLVRLDATAVQANLAKAEAAKKVLQAEREGAAVAVKQAALDVKSLAELKRSSNAALASPVALEKAGLALESAQSAVLALDRKLQAADKEEAALGLEIRLYTLTAPRKGRLGRLQVVVGQTLPAGAAVAEVIDIDDEIDVLCFVSAADARKVQLGQPAHVGGLEKESAAKAGADPEGKVVYVADQAEPETGSFAVKVRFPNRDLKLRANAVARVRVMTKPGKACWAVPESALMEDQEPPGIVVVEDVEVKKNDEGKEEKTGKARRVRAAIGMRDRSLGLVEILKLFDDSDKKWRGDLDRAQIVVEKGQGLQTGDAVKFEEEDDDDAAKPEAKPETKP